MRASFSFMKFTAMPSLFTLKTANWRQIQRALLEEGS